MPHNGRCGKADSIYSPIQSGRTTKKGEGVSKLYNAPKSPEIIRRGVRELFQIFNSQRLIFSFDTPSQQTKEERQIRFAENGRKKEKERTSLLGWEAGWSECGSANVPRVKPTYRVIGGLRRRKGYELQTQQMQ